MIYLSQLLGNSIYDLDGELLGTVSDLGIATGEVFPRVTSLAFMGPGKTPFMISWRKYVDSFDEHEIQLKVKSTDLRFSYLQPSEVLIARDLLDKQIVDTRGMRVVRVNDLKLSDTSSSQLRLLGAEVGVRGLLRSLSPRLEQLVSRVARSLGKPIPERIIAWNYMDLLERDLEMAAELVGGMEEGAASKMLSEMDPDDAVDLVAELDYEKAEKLLRLMGVKEQNAIRQLLGYRENTAGRIMTSEFVAVPEDGTVADAVEALRALDEGFESVRYVYLVDDEQHLTGVVTLVQLIVAEPETELKTLAEEDVVTVNPEDDQEDVAETIGKYNLLALPVVDDDEKLIGIVTVDDALEVLQEEHEEDLAIVGGKNLGSDDESDHVLSRLLTNEAWFFLWVVAVGVLVAATGDLTGNPVNGVLLSLGLPLTLRAAADMVRYVVNFFLEHDPDDEDSPSMVGFAARGVIAAGVYTGMAYLVMYALSSVMQGMSPAFPTGSTWMGGAGAATILIGFSAATICVLLTFATAPFYLAYLRKRDGAGEDSNGSSLRGTAMLLACVLYVAAALYLGVWA